MHLESCKRREALLYQKNLASSCEISKLFIFFVTIFFVMMWEQEGEGKVVPFLRPPFKDLKLIVTKKIFKFFFVNFHFLIIFYLNSKDLGGEQDPSLRDALVRNERKQYKGHKLAVLFQIVMSNFL